MKARYCLDDNTCCARLLAGELLGGLDKVPVDMLPSDSDRLETLKVS
jgi:hypothetical protein